MSQRKRSTTGLPGPTRREADVRKKYRPRSQREAETNRLVLIITAIIAAVIIAILGGAFLIDGVVKPAQAVANVGGTNISTRDFQKRVSFERWRQGNQIAQLYNNQYGRQYLSDSSNAYGQLYSQLAQPVLFGKRVLDQMTDELTIKQYANANNIKVDDAEVQKSLGQQFGYDPNPQSATPTSTPTLTLTPLVSATPTSTPTLTPTVSITPTLTASPFPTGIPTVTPGATEQKTQFEKTQTDVFAAAAKLTGLSANDIRDLFRQLAEQQVLTKQVREAVAGKLQPIQDEVKARHILVKTEEEANDVVKALQAGESFAALARSVSTDTGSGAQGGELGWATHGKYVKEFEDYAWSGKIGDVSGPIKSQFGYHIIQIEAREPRSLTDQEQQDVQTKTFSDWLTKTKTDKKTQTYDSWTDSVPTDPTLEQLGVPSNLSSGASSNPFGSSGLPGDTSFPSQ